MTYRDPREALQAENDCLRQELKEAHEQLASARAVPDGQDYERRRWAMGMRCLGSLAMVAPFLAMMSMCEHRAMRRAAWHSALASTVTYAPPGTVAHSGCPMAARAVGFERFAQAIERPARVSETTLGTLAVGDACTVRVVPVSTPEGNCHVEVSCGGRTVYGALPTGFAHCDFDQGRATRAVDPDPTGLDGDAAITVDLASSRVVIDDTAHGATSHLALRLDQALSLTR